MKRDDMAGASLLLHGEIAFDGNPPSLANVSVHVYLEDTPLADTSAKGVLHQVTEMEESPPDARSRFPPSLPSPQSCASLTLGIG